MAKIGSMRLKGMTFDQVVSSLLAFFVILSFAGFFLFPSSQANNFPTYFVAILMFVHFGFSGHFRPFRSIIFFSLCALLAYSMASVFWSEKVSDEDLRSSIGDVILLLLMILAIHSSTRENPSFVDLLSKCLVMFATISLITNSIQDFFSFLTGIQIGGRLATSTVASISYGFVIVVAGYLVVTVKPIAERMTWGACLLALIYGCISLSVHYVWLAIIAAVAVFAFTKVWESRGNSTVFGWMLLALSLMVAFLFLFDLVLVSDRQQIWQSVVDDAYNSYPIFGSGTLTPVTPHVDCLAIPRILSEFSNCTFAHPHNLYVSTMFHTGIVGLCLLLILMLVSVSAVVESDGKEKWLVLPLLCYGATVFLFDGDQFVSKLNFVWLVFWLPVGLAFSMEMAELEEDELME